MKNNYNLLELKLKENKYFPKQRDFLVYTKRILKLVIFRHLNLFIIKGNEEWNTNWSKANKKN